MHAWDLRRARRPVMTFVDWDAGATQVKWNRKDGHIVASSHDRWLRIWDDRHGAYPVKSIMAHTSKIYGVDWSRTRSEGVMTCSLDKTIKFWDYKREGDSLERTINCGFPIWRARHTPFPNGLLAMPQKSPGNLYLYDLRKRRDDEQWDPYMDPIATFTHGDRRVKEFLWRSRGTAINEKNLDDREFQLVSWGDDKELKLQRVPNSVLENVGYVPGTQVRKNQNFTRRGAIYKTFRNIERAAVDKKSATIRGPRMLGTSHDKENSFNMLSDGMKKMSPAKKYRSRLENGSTMRGKTTEAERRSQINWMSGVKFSSREGLDSTGQQKFPVRRLSVISPNFDIEGDWDAPETLHDEIIRVHHQYSKVKFEDINIDKRTIAVSCNGPWGHGGEPVFIKTTIRFPDNYPGAELPEFSVGRTSLISDETYGKISRELKDMTAAFTNARRGCLEAVICYLLGEVDLEESQIWLKGSDDIDNIDNLLDALADESSSESSSDELPEESSTLISASQELDPASTEGILAANKRHANVPLPRLCGARFSTTGKLVCFFPPKEDKFKSLLGSVGMSRNKSTGEPSFKSFNRLDVENMPRSKIAEILEDSDDEIAVESSADEISDSSSDSDSSMMHSRVGLGQVGPFGMPGWHSIDTRSWRKGLSTNRSNKSSGVGTGTGTGLGMGKARSVKSKNILALHDLRDILPAKIELAREYALYGEGADVCDHNAMVARKYGCQDLADIWTYAGMLLQHEVPLTVLSQSHRREPILVVARDIIRHHRQRQRRSSGSDSGVDLGLDTKPDPLSGRVKWGHSPLAKPLIDDMFAYFTHENDIQMLAMLSCVFNEPSTTEPLPIIDLKRGLPQTPLSMRTPAFSLDYFPSDIAAWSAYQRTPGTSKPGTPLTPLTATPTPQIYYGSLGSSNGHWASDPPSSYSVGTTPPLRSRGGSVEKLNNSDPTSTIHHGPPRNNSKSTLNLPSQTHSLSTSPEDSRTFRRANSGLAASIAMGLKNPFLYTRNDGSSSSSPPTARREGGDGRKRPSPVESMVSALTPSAVTWGSTTYLESVREKPSYPTSTYSDDGLAHISAEEREKVVGVDVQMWNQGAFDDEGCISIPLLETGVEKHAEFVGYRRLYADLLFAWRLPYTRLEILKFDSMPENAGPTAVISGMESKVQMPITPSTTTLPLGKAESITLPPPAALPISHATLDILGLSITGYCLKHESRLEPLLPTLSTLQNPVGGAVGRCERCAITKSQLRCVVCHEMVVAEYVACLGCGCVCHQACASSYFSTPYDGNSEFSENKGEMGTSSRLGDTQRSTTGLATTSRTGTWGKVEEVPKAGVPCPGGCDCECLTTAGHGVVESWEVMMGALEMMRKKEAKREADRLKKSSREASRNNSRSNSHARPDTLGTMSKLDDAKGRLARSKSEGGRRMTEEWEDEQEREAARSSVDVGTRPQSKKEGADSPSAPSSVVGGYKAAIGSRLGKVRASDGLGWARKKSSSLRNAE